MKKSVILLAFIASTFAFAQVGINNTNPQATLDVTAKTTDGSKAEGLLVPRLTGDQIQAANTQYTAAQSGVLIYATAAAASPSGKTVNMTTAGYYFFDGNIWQRVNTGSGSTLYTADGSLGASRIVDMPNRSLSFAPSGTQLTNQFNVDGSTFSVDALNNRVGIGSVVPTERLHVADGNVLISNSTYKDISSADQLAGQLLFKLGGNATETLAPVASINGIDKFSGGNYLGNLTFSTQNGSTIERMRIDHNGNVGIGTTAPNARLDLRTNPTSTTDPGAGMLGIGTTAATAAAAGAGAIRYSTTGELQYSNGTAWNSVRGKEQKAHVTGYFTGTVPPNFYGVLTSVEQIDLNNNFDTTFYVFTAPRTGSYTFSYTLSSDGNAVNGALTAWEVNIICDTPGQNQISRYISPVSYTGTISVNGSYTAYLTAGSQCTFRCYNGNGWSRTLGSADYNKWSIIEH